MKNLSLKTEGRVLRALLWLVRPHLWHGVAIGLLLAYIPGVVLLLGMAFLPLVVAQFLLPKQNDQLVLAMLFFIIATLVHPCRLVWQKGADWENCITIATQPLLLCLFWIGPAVAWFISECATMILQWRRKRSSIQRRKKLKSRIDELCEEWGFAKPPVPNNKS
ncbi:hypothetical protein [Kozakia baliensis]|uniref:hypothetical protein n=1 Tax=Kozakia baliensis TaxID=153496 RepID=UPI00087AA3D5|nr:hypothetical protein [Kozakia baliensis]AOX20365.1 hypothetical protein A0U90_08710 [Kozakia baliensis]